MSLLGYPLLDFYSMFTFKNYTSVGHIVNKVIYIKLLHS